MRTTEEIYYVEKYIFLVCGAYPLRTKGINFKQVFALFVLIFLSLGQFIPLAAQLQYAETISKATDTVLILSSQGAYLSKFLNYLFKRPHVLKIEDFLDDPIVKEAYKGRNEYLETQIVRLRYLKNFYRGACAFVVLFYGLVPFLDDGVRIPQESWYPIDKEKYRSFIWIFQIVTLFATACMNSNLDLHAASLIIIGASLFNILKERLKSVDYTKDVPEKKNEELNYCVLLHKHTLTYIGMVENLYSFGILVQFLTSIVVICVSGFQMLVVPIPSAQFLMLLSYLSAMMTQVSVYCWYGNEIITQSEDITTACYMSNWYEATQRTKKALFIMMERSKKNVNLTAGKFFILSLTTLVMILKSSYSYFAVLQRIYKDS